MEPVPLLDLQSQYRPLRDEILRAIEHIADAQSFVLGAPVDAFEGQVAAYVRSQHAVGCASGTDALILALAALNVGEGDEVLTTPFSFFSTASCAYKVGARPAFADIDPRTFNLDPESAEGAITPRTRALLPVHLFGQCADMESLLALGRKHELPVVEDAAQALGAGYDIGGSEAHAGTMGRVGCYSFFPTKNLGGFGDGGMTVTDDPEIAERIRLLRVHGGQQMYHHRWVGWNSRLDALQAAVLSVKLPHLDDWSADRRDNADRYDRWFRQLGLIDSGAVSVPYRSDRARHIFNQYTIRVRDRDALREHLRERQIGHSVYYPVALHLQECFEELGYREGQFPEAERACREVLALPVFPGLPAEMQERVAEAVAEFFRDR